MVRLLPVTNHVVQVGALAVRDTPSTRSLNTGSVRIEHRASLAKARSTLSMTAMDGAFQQHGEQALALALRRRRPGSSWPALGRWRCSWRWSRQGLAGAHLRRRDGEGGR